MKVLGTVTLKDHSMWDEEPNDDDTIQLREPEVNRLKLLQNTLRDVLVCVKISNIQNLFMFFVAQTQFRR
jgi:hypothetical protein